MLFKQKLNILGHRRLYFTVSVLLIVAAAIVVPLRGVNFGIEFAGGNSMIISDAGDVSIEQMRKTCSEAGLKHVTIQSTFNVYSRTSGFVISTVSNLDMTVSAANLINDRFGFASDQIQVQAIGSSWRNSALLPSLLALGAAVLVILLYQVIRFGYKAAFATLVGLLHTALLSAGLFMVVGFLVTLPVAMTLFAVVGYAAYTTTLHIQRINQDVQKITNQSFITVANESINQLLARTLSITLAALIPLTAVLLFAGSTMFELALAMIIGVIISPCSTVMIAIPIYVILRQREPVYRKLLDRYGEELSTSD